MENETDNILYAIADKHLLDKAIANEPFLTHMEYPIVSKYLLHTIMENKEEILDYVKQIDKQQAKLMKKLGDKSSFGYRYIIKFTKVNDHRVKILEKIEHTNDYLMLI